MDRLRFTLNDQPVEVEGVAPDTTLLQWLRRDLRLTGTKEGCAEGDCGACTVAVLDAEAPGGPAFRAVNACLVLLPMVHGRRVYTVESLAEDDRLHPVQEALVDTLGSQCGYCTPGVVMSMFEAAYRGDMGEAWQIDDQMCGNLCRCTGYRPIREATERVAGSRPDDRFARALSGAAPASASLDYAAGGKRWIAPGSLPALWDALDAHPGARLVAGATDLALEVTKRFRELPLVVSLEAVPELRTVEHTPTGFTIGAGVTLTDLQAAVAGDLPALDRMLRVFASRQIRNRATIGGNLCNASPIGDLAPVLIALGTTAVLGSRAGDRRLPLEDFFVAYRETALRPGEVLRAVEIPLPSPGDRVASFKASRRRELDISAVAAGFAVRTDAAGRVTRARLAYGGMAATPARARRAEATLLGARWDAAAVEDAARALAWDFQPIDDARGSAWYRATVAANLLRGFFAGVGGTPSPEQPVRPGPTGDREAGA